MPYNIDMQTFVIRFYNQHTGMFQTWRMPCEEYTPEQRYAEARQIQETHPSHRVQTKIEFDIEEGVA